MELCHCLNLRVITAEFLGKTVYFGGCKVSGLREISDGKNAYRHTDRHTLFLKRQN